MRAIPKSSSRRKVPGTPAPRSYVIPTCSACGAKAVKNDAGEWFCPDCADKWLKEYVANKVGDKSMGGVELPSGVKDLRRAAPSFRDLAPNRSARRRIQRARSS